MKNKEIHEQIGARLKQYRKSLGYTQERMAEILDLSENYYGKIERGNRQLSIDLLHQMSLKFKIDMNYLITGYYKEQENEWDKILRDYTEEQRCEILITLQKLCNLIKDKKEE